MPVIEYDSQFHADFSDSADARMVMFSLARNVLRDEEVDLPLRLTDQ